MHSTRIIAGFLAVAVLIGNSLALAEDANSERRSKWRIAGSDTIYKPEEKIEEPMTRPAEPVSDPAPNTILVPEDLDQPKTPVTTVTTIPPAIEGSGDVIKLAVALVAIPVVTFILYKAFFPAAIVGGMVNDWSPVVQQYAGVPFGTHYGDEHVPNFNDGIDQEVSNYFAGLK